MGGRSKESERDKSMRVRGSDRENDSMRGGGLSKRDRE